MKKTTKLKKYFKSEYSIEIETNKLEKKYYRIEKFSEKELDKELSDLKKLIEIYPKIFIKNSGLNKIFIFKNWWWKGKDSEKELKIGGISYGNGVIGLSKPNHSFHHELYHCTDFTDNKIVGDDNHKWGVENHGEDYKKMYGKNGFAAIGDKLDKKKRPKGFASAYGMYGGIQEDQAEIGEALMKNEKVLESIESEPKLKNKVKMTKEFYYARSEGKMDDKFWKDLHSGKKIDEKYWEKRDNFVLINEYEKAKRKFMKINSVSIIIPVYKEKDVENKISYLNEIGFSKSEIIVVDGVKEKTLTRSGSMNLGAKKATGDILLFLHIDTTLPDSAFIKLTNMNLNKYGYGGFYKKFSLETFLLKIISFLNNLGTRNFKTLLGDNSIFIKRELFEKIGGFPDISLMEDIEISKKLNKIAKAYIIKDYVITSSRKFIKNGIFRTFLFMQYIRFLYFFGTKTSILEKKYREFGKK